MSNFAQKCIWLVLCVSDEGTELQVIPLHGLGPVWKSIRVETQVFMPNYTGIITTVEGPKVQLSYFLFISFKSSIFL